MWKWLNSFAQPEKTYNACNGLLPYFLVSFCVFLPLGLIWGLAFAPTDYQQFDVYRIIYLHVPSATLSLSVYASMAAAAFIGMVWQWRNAFSIMIALAPIGAVITFISLMSGSLWGKPTWGTYWFWDARLTSQLILLFLYIGILVLYSSFEDKQQGSKAAAIMAMVGVINLPIIKYSVEWWNSIHQSASISKLDKPSMPAEMYIPLFVSILGLLSFIAFVGLIRVKNELIKRDAHRPWVKQQIKTEQNTPQKLISKITLMIIILGWLFGAYVVYLQGFEFSSFQAFIDMGERAFFVWTSYALGLLALLLLWMYTLFEQKSIFKQAIRQIERVEKIMAQRAKRKSKLA